MKQQLNESNGKRNLVVFEAPVELTDKARLIAEKTMVYYQRIMSAGSKSIYPSL